MITFNLAAVSIQKWVQAWITKKRKYTRKSFSNNQYRLHESRYDRVLSLHTCLFYNIAAIQIQSLWRQWKQKQYLKLCYSYTSNAVYEQRSDGHKNVTESKSVSSIAAVTIQKFWRGQISKKVYKIFRDLICFRLVGNPRQLLKTINPSEAELFDRSNNIYLRFRLGGCNFPPFIYYKVFSHGAVCDIGSFAPRDYVKKDFVQDDKSFKISNDYKGTISVGHKTYEAKISVDSNGTDGWYHRIENNGWRTVAIDIQDEIMRNITTRNKSSKQHLTIRNHLSQRESRDVKKRKNKYKRWRNLYKHQGLHLDEKKAHEVPNTLVPFEHVPRISQGVESPGFVEGENNKSETINDMLMWLNNLNCDEYMG